MEGEGLEATDGDEDTNLVGSSDFVRVGDDDGAPDGT